MSLLSSFRKNKQESVDDDGAYQSRSDGEAPTIRPRKRKLATRGADGNAPVDPVLPEKKRARRRLVGAVALVLAVIIGLPMVLDSEPKPLPDDLTIEIPSRDRPPAAKPGERAGDKSGGKRDGAALSRVPAAAALDQKEEVIDMPAAGIATTVAAVAPKAPPQARSAENTVKPKPTPAKPKSEAIADKPAPAATEKSTATTGGDTRHEKFTVQVAAFASPEKVNELRGKLKEAGIASYTQKVATEDGDRIRIRVGPLNSKQDADKLRAKLSALGLKGTLVPSPS